MAVRRMEAVSSASAVHYRSGNSTEALLGQPQAQHFCPFNILSAACNLSLLAGYGVIVPVTPTLMTDFFASRHSDVYIHCEDYTSYNAPLPCRDAHSDAVNWSSASSFVSNSILSFALVGVSGLSYLQTCPSVHALHAFCTCLNDPDLKQG